jgi:hypothetical protein
VPPIIAAPRNGARRNAYGIEPVIIAGGCLAASARRSPPRIVIWFEVKFVPASRRIRSCQIYRPRQLTFETAKFSQRLEQRIGVV